MGTIARPGCMRESPPSVLVTLPTDLREEFFPPELAERLESTADVDWNEGDEQLSAEELADRLAGVDVVVTGWGTPTLTREVLADADALEVVAHTAGSVAPYVSEALYDRGVTVCSANREMARFVAEQALAHALAAERNIVSATEVMRTGGYDRGGESRTLFGAELGLVGLGTTGRFLLPLVAPFDVTVRVYDPYVSRSDVAEYDFLEKATLAGALEGADVVSIHAARTPETIGLLGADELARIPDGALLVNTARAELVDREALLAELESGRIRAALDVFHQEPLPPDSPLRELENVQLTPHTGGSSIRRPLAAAMVEEIERYADGRALQHEIPREQAELMTR